MRDEHLLSSLSLSVRALNAEHFFITHQNAQHKAAHFSLASTD